MATDLTAADAPIVARWAYMHGRDKLVAGGTDVTSMPVWADLPQAQKDSMAADVIDMYQALLAHGYTIMKA